MLDMPYFMENNEWFEINPNGNGFILTDRATEKARASYQEYYKQLKLIDKG